MVLRAVMRVVWAIVAMFGVLVLLPTASAAAAEESPSRRPGSLTPNQLYGGRALTPAEAAAACGPAAAVAFARAVGRPVSLDTAVAVARQVGWTPAQGMSGPHSQLSLLKRLNVPATIEAGLNVGKLTREIQAGRPVIIRTSGRPGVVPGHYFVAERVDPATGRFDLAQSALVLRASGGRRWFTLGEIAALGVGAPTHAIYLSTGNGPERRDGPVTLAAASASAPKPLASRAGAGSHVVATGGPGARLRSAPSTDSAVVGSLRDGTRISLASGSKTIGGRTWLRVTVSGGGTAWIDAGLLRAL